MSDSDNTDQRLKHGMAQFRAISESSDEENNSLRKSKFHRIQSDIKLYEAGHCKDNMAFNLRG